MVHFFLLARVLSDTTFFSASGGSVVGVTAKFSNFCLLYLQKYNSNTNFRFLTKNMRLFHCRYSRAAYYGILSRKEEQKSRKDKEYQSNEKFYDKKVSVRWKPRLYQACATRRGP